MAKKIKHQGLHAHRLNNPDNIEEKRFAKEWRELHERSSTLNYLLDPRPEQSGRPPDISERDEKVAATVIQWLGSPVGQSFLFELGYFKKG